MTGWLLLTDEQRMIALEQASQKSSIKPAAIEKDWWVTLVLKALFEGPFAKFMVFKGGTSLSKCWNLIERFSEDIDIALEPEAFQMKYAETPSKSAVKQLKRSGCIFTTTVLKEAVEKQLNILGVPEGQVKITADDIDEKMPDKDPQTIFVSYPSLYETNPYLKNEVRIEVSVRSMKEPATERKVQSLLHEFFPNAAYAENPFVVMAADPIKTFLEKCFLLHEEFLKPDRLKIRNERMSRHIYDIASMIKKGIDNNALQNHSLYAAIIKHRKYYSMLSWVDYSTHDRKSISFLLPADLKEVYQSDYKVMQEQMIYGEQISFESIQSTLEALLKKFREYK
jgi:Nucleotidyl transferase AbiEii toxin, Type IV TA system